MKIAYIAIEAIVRSASVGLFQIVRFLDWAQAYQISNVICDISGALEMRADTIYHDHLAR
ncbi:hypothetical protein UFOVP470_52 [uncultured Caudovirales phage]|uniref:Uncharacterized protein n=1 Tax=uncultured Caudovirales phage TaxID=2100421 RepID=A0A6J5MES8_9CAUD|nr:hypothetical protein UFOVP470_52 [uncultured Caudovirales phage]